jgi:hypothetical protein
MEKKDFSEEPRLKEIMSEGIDGNVVLVGFPHDMGAKRISRPFG